MHLSRRMSVLVCAFVATGALLWPAAAFAQRSRFGRGPLRRVVVVRGYWPYYDPWFWGFDPWSPFLAPYPYAFGPAGYGDAGSARIQVTPRDAEVYVDGYLAGIVDDFDGFMQRLRLPPGEHEIELYRETAS